jgi:hypothetical protein
MMQPQVVHFLNIIVGRSVCVPRPEGESPLAVVDPARVTCPWCRRYLESGWPADENELARDSSSLGAARCDKD